jgi:hypothetical protein
LADTVATHASLDALEKEGSPITGTILPGQHFCIGLGRALVEAERDYILQNREELLQQAPDDLDFARLPKVERLGKVV